MQRFGLFLAALAAISQGCTYDPHNGESVNGSSYAPHGYSLTSGGVVVHYLANAENGSKSDFADIYESGNGWGVYASSSPTSWYGYTGYKWQWPTVNIGTTYPDVVGCINPGVTDDAHSYFKTVFGGSILGGTSGSVGGYVMNSDPATCWSTYAAGQSTNAAKWNAFNSNCLLSGSSSDVGEIFYDVAACDSTTPPAFDCSTSNDVRVCFPEFWPNGTATSGNVKVYIDFLNGNPSSTPAQCITDGTDSGCGTSPSVGFYQDGEPLCLDAPGCEYILWACVHQSSGEFDYVCTGTVDADQFGIFANYNGDNDFFASPAY